MTRTRTGLLAAMAMVSVVLSAESIMVDVKNVPLERVIANLEREVKDRPADVDLRVNLARVHAMAYAQKRSSILTATVVGRPVIPWVDNFVPAFQQFEVKRSNDAKVNAAAREQLTKAIARYREALAIAPGHPVARMGLGWTLSQAGERAEAISVLRELIADFQAKDQRQPGVMMGFRTLSEEAIRYLIPLLDPDRDREEIDRLRTTAKALARVMRPITPIAIPLADGLTALDVVDPNASVTFDLDGSALPQRWTWIRPTAAWLVFDRHSTGSITSGLQLFGSVTFWLFWQNGYDALRTLDDNGDRQIAGAELTGLALWHDRNANGRSDRGEVRSVTEWGIASLSREHEFDSRHPDEIAMSARGVTFTTGETRPTFDIVLRPASR